MENTNPKALNLDALRNIESSVTLGFKCPPELKLTLAKEAENSGLTLSSYVCKLVEYGNEEKKMLEEKNEILTNALNKIQSELKFFKNEILFELLKKYKGNSTSYFDRDGKKVELEVNSIKDIYILLINSFKYQK